MTTKRKIKSEINPADMPLIHYIVKATSNQVLEGEFLEWSRWNVSKIVANMYCDNAEALMHWQNDIIAHASGFLQGMNIDSSQHHTTVLIHSESVIECALALSKKYRGDQLMKHVSRKNFWRRAPYLFWQEGIKLTAYYIGRDALQQCIRIARHVAMLEWEKDQNINDRIILINAKHIAASLAAIAPMNFATTFHHEYAAAMRGEKCRDPILKQITEYVMLNKSPDTLPDLVSLLTEQ